MTPEYQGNPVLLICFCYCTCLKRVRFKWPLILNLTYKLTRSNRIWVCWIRDASLSHCCFCFLVSQISCSSQNTPKNNPWVHSEDDFWNNFKLYAQQSSGSTFYHAVSLTLNSSLLNSPKITGSPIALHFWPCLSDEQPAAHSSSLRGLVILDRVAKMTHYVRWVQQGMCFVPEWYVLTSRQCIHWHTHKSTNPSKATALS